jgi:hypothetical protein
MARLIAACLASLAIAPAFAQTPDNQLGARICGAGQQISESEAQYEARLAAEDRMPEWIWAAVDTMQDAPDRMTFTFRVAGGERVLVADGLIDRNAAVHLRRALKRHAPISEIWFNSPGGDSEVGMEMGHILRDEFGQVGVRVRAGEGCASACSTAFLGGFMRMVEPGALYGVHMYSTDARGLGGVELSKDVFNDIQWQGARGASERLIYVQQMGISLKWLDLWSATPPGCMTFLSQDELGATLVNNVVG